MGLFKPRAVADCGAMTQLLCALALFFLTHAIPAVPALKGAVLRLIGPRGYGAMFGTISLAALAWVVVAAGAAPYVELWPQTQAARWAANLLMPLAILLATFAAGAPNPLSFGGRPEGFDPARPGIVGVTRHPLLWALALWATAHLLVNGDLAHVLVFGSFLVFALAGIPLLDARHRRARPDWPALAANTSALPLAAWLTGRWRPQADLSLRRLAAAGAIWGLLLWAHPGVIGVSPLP